MGVDKTIGDLIHHARACEAHGADALRNRLNEQEFGSAQQVETYVDYIKRLVEEIKPVNNNSDRKEGDLARDVENFYIANEIHL